MILKIGEPWEEEGYEGGKWYSFEYSDTPGDGLLKMYYNHCQPCMRSLYRQLKSGETEINPGIAMDCIKVVSIVSNLDNCKKIVEGTINLRPSEALYGKYGGPKKPEGTYPVIAYAGPDDYCAILETVKKTSLSISPDCSVFESRGCDNLHGEVLGTWENWQNESPIIKPENVDLVLGRLKDSVG